MAFKRNLMSVLASVFLAIAALVTNSGSSFFFGEPQPPKCNPKTKP